MTKPSIPNWKLELKKILVENSGGINSKTQNDIHQALSIIREEKAK